MLSVTGNVSLNANLKSDEDLGQAQFPSSMGVSLALSDGVAANQSNLLFSDQRTTATEELDLVGSLLDAYGQAVDFARIKGLMIKAASANTVDIHVGGAAGSPWVGPLVDVTDEVAIPPGGAVLFWSPDADGWPVTATTADLLKIAASDGTTPITYDIMIIGADA